MEQPNPLTISLENALGVADYYEYSMAYANQQEGIQGQQAVFDFVVRNMPTNKVVGEFTHEGTTYQKLATRTHLINAGLEQAIAFVTEAKSNADLAQYLFVEQGIHDKEFLDWAKNAQFTGDIYAIAEGVPFFAQEPQLQLVGTFEECQLYESILLNTINPQTNVATTANDIAKVTDKILLEGGSRRAGSPQGSLYNSRASLVGGFHASSNVAFGQAYDSPTGGTHGHSYVMLHPSEYAAFTAQAQTFKDDVCFLLDTYDVKNAFDTALTVTKENDLEHIAFRIDSGDLLEQAHWIHQQMQERGFSRDFYTLVASDDLTAGKIQNLEENNADIDKYLVGTYVTNPPKPLGGVLKLAAFTDKKGVTHNRGKLCEDPRKATMPGFKQVYRIRDEFGMNKYDVIALRGESIDQYMEYGETAHSLLELVVKEGEYIRRNPSLNQIRNRREDELRRFYDIDNYEVKISPGITAAMNKVRAEFGYKPVEVAA